jgi:hypothetical protein
MEVDAKMQLGIGSLHRLDDGLDLGRIGDADGVAEADGLHAGVHIVLEEGHNSVGILVFAFKGAAEGSGQIHDHVQVEVGSADLLISFQRLLMGAVNVGLIVSLPTISLYKQHTFLRTPCGGRSDRKAPCSPTVYTFLKHQGCRS